MNEDTLLAQINEYNAAVARNADQWVPACGGKEMPFEINGRRFQDLYNPKLGEHAYYSIDDDLILEYQELPDCLRGI